jgi:hypothetical protein
VGSGRRHLDLVVAAACARLSGCGWLPPDRPPETPAPSKPDAAVVHDWKITGHVLGPRALISDLDDAGFHERTVAVTTAGYTSPLSGRCDDARREHQPRTLADLADAHELARDRAAGLGLSGARSSSTSSCASPIARRRS